MFEFWQPCLKELFHAGGQGVSYKLLTAAMEPAHDVLTAMGMTTDQLRDCLDAAQACSAALVRRQHPKACSDADALLCILSHRADEAASKYLKAKYKLPKIDGKGTGRMF
jgi:hypothetical protein